MKKHSLAILLTLACCPALEAEDPPKTICENGVCRLVDASAATASGTAAEVLVEEPARIAQGYMPAEKFIAFLDGEVSGSGSTSPARLPSSFILLPFFLVLAGLALNLTPCVLPMIPVNLIVIGRSAKRGVAYGLGIALAYGALGVAAAAGGLAFGTIQSSPWFNAAVAAIFVILSASLSDAFAIDFSKWRTRLGRPNSSGLIQPLFLGGVSALLAGACVAPVLASVLLLTADLFAKGIWPALALPFLVGAGMALPWPFLGAGMKILPKPGPWMKWVNKAFAAIVLCFAAWYASLAWRGFSGAGSEDAEVPDGGAETATPETFAGVLDDAVRPVLVDCWASWCKNCAAMDRVMAEDGVKEKLRSFTVIRLRAEDIRALRAVPGFGKIQGLPAFAIFE